MSIVEIKIAVAEECEYTDIRSEYCFSETQAVLEFCGTKNGIRSIIPNYPESLDACREFEKDAPKECWDMTYDVCNPAGALGCVDGHNKTDEGWINVANRTPKQACESYLRWHGKWKK